MLALRLAAQLHQTCCSVLHVNHLNWIYCAQPGLFEKYSLWRWEHGCLSWLAAPPPTPAVTLVNISFVLILMESQHCTTVPLKTLALIIKRNNNVMENTSTQSAVWQHEKGLLRIGPRCHCRYMILSEIITFLMRFAYMFGRLNAQLENCSCTDSQH